MEENNKQDSHFLNFLNRVSQMVSLSLQSAMSGIMGRKRNTVLPQK